MKKLTIEERLVLAEQRAQRFRDAKDTAEQLLEEKSKALYEANQALQTSRDNLQIEIEQATSDLVSANSKLARALDEKPTFIGSISHEIRTPLYAIAGLSELLLDTSMTSLQKDYIETIFESSVYLEKLLTDVLHISKIESGKVELYVRATNPKEALHSLTRMFNSEANSKGIDLKCQLDGNLPHWIEIDDGRYRQIITNLVSNALKNTHKGEINISAHFYANPDQPNQGSLVTVVSDTGVGIKPEQIERIFSAYEQFGNLDQGVGLGLAICQQLADLMNGQLACTSESGVGSQFKLTIPVQVTNQPQETEVNTDVTHELTKLKVLVAEDSPSIQHVIRAQFGKFGIVPMLVNNGQEALDAMASNHFDIVFLDLHMPVMDGEQTIKAIKSSPEYQHHYCVALTAVSVSGAKENILGMGFDDYQSKPISLDELQILLYRNIDRITTNRHA